jgi:hypothetical protein
MVSSHRAFTTSPKRVRTGSTSAFVNAAKSVISSEQAGGRPRSSAISSRYALGGVLHRPCREIRVAFRRFGAAAPKQSSDDQQAVAGVGPEAGERVSQVVDANVLQARGLSQAIPRLLDVDQNAPLPAHPWATRASDRGEFASG